MVSIGIHDSRPRRFNLTYCRCKWMAFWLFHWRLQPIGQGGVANRLSFLNISITSCSLPDAYGGLLLSKWMTVWSPLVHYKTFWSLHGRHFSPHWPLLATQPLSATHGWHFGLHLGVSDLRFSLPASAAAVEYVITITKSPSLEQQGVFLFSLGGEGC